MKHALGGARASWSRKTDLITHIVIRRNIGGMSVAESRASVKGYNRKTVDQLGILAKESQNP